jgi:uncharacterized protein YecE (DUF72 family)
MRPVHVGCSGWNYSDWRETVYPKGLPARLWLEHYATLFDTVEVNATFYRLPKRETVAHWVEVTPDDFVFSIKASRYLTHIKRLRDLGKYVGNLLERLEPQHGTAKMGPLLWQLPPTFQRDDARLSAAIEQMPKLRNTIEFRHPSWFVPEVYELLSSYGVALAVGDSPKYPFMARERTTDWTFIRLHYGARGRRGNYSEAELETWKRRIASWRAEAEVYVYANNDWEAFAVRNATWLRDRLR